MTDEEKEILVRQFLDDELIAEQEKEALQIMAEEPELRDLLHLEISLNRAFRESGAEARSFQVPADFSDHVMEAIETREEETAGERSTEEAEAGKERSPEKSDIWQRVRESIDSLFEPRAVRLRPVYGLAAAVAAVAIILALNIGIDPSQQSARQIARTERTKSAQSERAIKPAAATSTTEQSQVWTRFFYVDNDAQSVAVAGDFSNWEPIPLNKKQLNGKTVWTGKVQMKKGEHRYMYLINGKKWKTDPLAQRYAKDGFGNRNAVLSL